MAAPRVLVIEDDRMVSSVIQDALEEEGYSALSAETAVRLDEVQTLQPALIILDLWLNGIPEGCDWLGILKATPGVCRIPVIVCSADSAKLAESAAIFEQLAAAVVTKPFDLDPFLQQVRAIIDTSADAEARRSSERREFATTSPGDRTRDGAASLAVCLFPAGRLSLVSGVDAVLLEARWRQLGWVWEDGRRMGFVQAEIDGASWAATVPLTALPIGSSCSPVTLKRQSPRVLPSFNG